MTKTNGHHELNRSKLTITNLIDLSRPINFQFSINLIASSVNDETICSIAPDLVYLRKKKERLIVITLEHK